MSKNISAFFLNESEDGTTAEECLKNDLEQEKKEFIQTNSIPWIEKYRPKSIEDVVLEPNTYTKIKKIIEERDMPNIIITGMPGIGKTTTIQCIARSIFGKYVNELVLELNASDDRGIKAVQDTIITFCKKKIDINKDNKQKYAEHKIIILDEADNMTSKAQRLINNLMEKYHKTTRFAFTCNNSSDIIEAIQSRCIIFRYYRLNVEQVVSRLKTICTIESVPYEEEALGEIAIFSQGDLRHAINNLQLTFNGFSEITIDFIYQICDKPQPVIIKKIFKVCLDKNLMEALKILFELKEKGYSGSDITLSMMNTLRLAAYYDISEEDKIKLSNKVAKATNIISRGVDTNLQLTSCIASIIND
jgi:replication factor C subunit 2/4